MRKSNETVSTACFLNEANRSNTSLPVLVKSRPAGSLRNDISLRNVSHTPKTSVRDIT